MRPPKHARDQVGLNARLRAVSDFSSSLIAMEARDDIACRKPPSVREALPEG